MDGSASAGSRADQGSANEDDPAIPGDPACRVALLGPMHVDPALAAADLGQPKQRELLAVLALSGGRVVRHDALAEALWEGAAPRTYAHSLQVYVSALRRVLAAAGSRVDIETYRQGYRLALDREDVDILRFGRLIDAGVAAVTRGQWRDGADQLERAMALWRGPALMEFETREFAHEASAAAHRQRLDGLEALATAQLELGDTAAALRHAAEVVASDGLRERAHGILMLGLYRTGRAAEALRTYEDARRQLDDELGAVPSRDLRELHARILRHDETLLAPRNEPPELTVHHGLAAVAQPGDTTSATPPDHEPSVGLQRRHRGLAATATAAAVVAGVVLGVVSLATSLSAGQAAAAPGPAILLYHGGGEVNMLVEDGFDRAVTDFGLVARELSTDESDAATLIDKQVTAGAMLLDFTIETDTAAAARRHPATSFVALDEQSDDDEPNLATIRFSSHEAAYLAGFAAARTSATGTVGFIGGVDYATIWPFEAGFEAGVRAANPDVRILTRYLSEPPRYGEGFLDPELGERTAQDLFAAGADVIFAAAGTSGLGVFEAAAEGSTAQRRLWGIGVDSDQYETVAMLPGTVDVTGWRRHILTSVMLRFDNAVYSALADHAGGQFRPGLHRQSLANGGVDISFSGGYLEELRDDIDTVRRSIASGQISVPCRPARLPPEPAVACS